VRSGKLPARLVSEWRRQRDTINDTEGADLSFEEWKPYEAIIGKAGDEAHRLAKQIWQRAKAETWSPPLPTGRNGRF
jgi:hypothetical protein